MGQAPSSLRIPQDGIFRSNTNHGKRLHMDTIVVPVTALDIEDGQAADCSQCPIALALLRNCGEVSTVYADAIYIKRDCGWSPPLRTCAAVETFIRAFDRGQFVAPFEFTLTIP